MSNLHSRYGPKRPLTENDIARRVRVSTNRARDTRVHPLCARLRQARLDRGWSLAEVAARTGFYLQQIGGWETGVFTPSLDVLDRWAAAFDLVVELR